MHERILEKCRQRVRTRDYVITLHADDEMAADGYSILDVESGILTGTIIERQRDRETKEQKYRIAGVTSSLRPIEGVVRFGATGMLVIITVYEP